MTTSVTWRKTNTIFLYDTNGHVISRLKWNLETIDLTGCGGCKTPTELRELSKGADTVSWTFSLKDGLFQIGTGGEIFYERQLPKECASIYENIDRFSFSDSTCKGSYGFNRNDMKRGAKMDSDCGVVCPQA